LRLLDTAEVGIAHCQDEAAECEALLEVDRALRPLHRLFEPSRC
jgi:hypothetical protein